MRDNRTYYDRQRTYTIEEINKMTTLIKRNQMQRCLSVIAVAGTFMFTLVQVFV